MNGIQRQTKQTRKRNAKQLWRLNRAAAESLECRRLLAITVNTLVDQVDGSITDGTISLRDAISASPAGGTINFSVTGTIHLALGRVEVNKNLTIAGPGASQLTIDGGGHSTVIHNANGITSTLSGLTISGGNDTVDFGGGGVRNEGTLTISNSVISGNTALLGGGIYSNGENTSLGLGFLTVVNSTISGNQAVTSTNDPLAGKGGGIYATNYSTANVSNSTLSGNKADGNGIFGAGGAAIYGDPTITDSTISGNSASGGGGAIQGGYATVIQSTICNNFVAGILVEGGASIAQSTIVGNDYGIEGVGVTLSNSIVAGNAVDIDATLDPTVCHNNLIGGASGGLTNGVNGNIVNIADPGLELDNNNRAVLGNHGGPTQTVLVYDSSPAVNHGNNSLIPTDPSTGQPFTTDQNGAPRVFNNGTVDIGATEVQGAVVASTVVNTAVDEVAANSTTSLREAIGFAEQSTPAIVTFDPTVFSTPRTIQLVLGELRVFSTSGAITIDGPGASLVKIDGQHLSSDFETLGVATLSGLTITNGSGIQEDGGTLTVSNSVITNNSTTGDGGGINDDGGSLTITNSTISGNQAGNGGGIASNFGGSVSISDSTISGNQASDGGGIFSFNGVTLTNSTISGNTASNLAGGIYLSGGGTITDSTISNNTIAGVLSGGSGLTLTNTIIAGNAPLDFVGDPFTTNSTNNLIGNAAPDAGGLVNGVNGNIVGVDPHLGPLADNGGTTQTMALLPSSPAINAGVTISGVTTDQRGIARPQGTLPDIGAFERAAAITSIGYDFDARQAVTFNFSENDSPTFARPNSILQNLTSNQTIANTTGSFGFNGPGTQATLVLTNLLSDANYRVTVTSGVAPPLDFFVLAGDANHDRFVNTVDFMTLAQNFNKSSATFSQGDFNYDGKVNALDFNILATKFGTHLLPAAPAMIVNLAITPAASASPAASPLASLFGTKPVKSAPLSDVLDAAEN